jgi:hypothetical protein
MEPKRLYFLLATATTVGAVAGAYGDDVVFSEQTLVGQNQAVVSEEIIRPTPAAHITQLQNRIESQSCPVIDSKFGFGSCVKETIDYDIVFHRKRGREWVVRRYPQFDHRERFPTAPGVSDWINTRLEAYCSRPNTRYGPGVCSSSSTDYMLRYIRNGGQTRTIVKLEARVYCTSTPPVDPNPPEDPP